MRISDWSSDVCSSDLVAAANAGEKGKALKAIISDCLEGTNGRAKSEPWVPQWMAFPPTAYTSRGGVGSVKAAARVAFDLSASIAPAATEDGISPESDRKSTRMNSSH